MEQCGSLVSESRHTALPLSLALSLFPLFLSLARFLLLCFLLVLLNTKLLREVCVLLWWLTAPQNNTCSTDECGEREGRAGLYNIMYPKTLSKSYGATRAGGVKK